MNDTHPPLPENYTPYNELIICGNILINVKVPIELNKKIPFLIGKGDIPLIWFSIPVTKDAKNWQEIVVKNESLNKKVSIITSEEDSSVIVKADNHILICVKKISDEKAVVSILDLQPLGLNIHGDTNGLYIGKSLLSKNTFNNVHTMIGIS